MYEVYVGREGTRYGPFSEDEVRQMALDGRLAGTDLFWCAGMAQWESAEVILAAVGRPTSAAPPPMPAAAPTRTSAAPAIRTHEMPGAPKPLPARPVVRLSQEHRTSETGAPRPAAKVDELVVSPLSGKPLSKRWQRRFDEIEQVVGPGMERYSSLKTVEKLGLYMGIQGNGQIKINILAGLLGSFYYLAKGMWRPAISLLLIYLVVVFFLSAGALEIMYMLDANERSADRMLFAIGVSMNLFIFGGPANFLYYRKRMGLKPWL